MPDLQLDPLDTHLNNLADLEIIVTTTIHIEAATTCTPLRT